MCVEVARGFYTSLVEQGALRLERRGIAAALHSSVMEKRAKTGNGLELGAIRAL